MQHDLFSSLDSLLSVPAGSGGLLIRDVTGHYRPAEADEVLLAAQRLLAAQVRGSDLMDSPAVVKEWCWLSALIMGGWRSSGACTSAQLHRRMGRFS